MSELDIYLILDGSGSMRPVQADVVKGVNEFIEEQKEDKKDTGDDIRLSLTVFDDQVFEEYLLEDIDLIQPVTQKDTLKGGSTALFDAIGRTVTRAEADNYPTRKLLVIYTDGGENASREYKKDQIRELLERLQDTGLWQIVYMSAELEDFQQPQSIGISGGNILTGTTRASTAQQFQALSSSAKVYRKNLTGTTTDYYAAVAAAAPAAGEVIVWDTIGGKSPDKAPEPTPDQGDPGDESDA